MLLASSTSHAASTVPDISIGHAFFQMVIALAVIAACAWAGTKLLARLRGGAGARPRGDSSNGLTVLSRQPLGKGLQIAVVRWGEREVLVGISGTTITFLSDPRVDEPEAEPAPFPTNFGQQPAITPWTMPAATPPITRTVTTRPVTTRPVATRTVATRTTTARRPFLESLRDATSRR